MKHKDSHVAIEQSLTRYALYVVVLMVVVLTIGCDIRYGALESSFRLADDSRLPKWFELPEGYSRRNVRLTISFYSHPLYAFLNADRAVMTLYGPAPGNAKLMEKVGTYKWHPLTEKQGYDTFPRYIIVAIDGEMEVFAKMSAGDILYVSDDPKVTSVINKTGKQEKKRGAG